MTWHARTRRSLEREADLFLAEAMGVPSLPPATDVRGRAADADPFLAERWGSDAEEAEPDAPRPGASAAGPRWEIAGFPRHSSDVGGLSQGERDKIARIAAAIRASLAPGAQPIREVQILGHADGDPEGHVFEWQISEARARSVEAAIRAALGDRAVSDALTIWIDGAGATKPVVRAPATEPQRARNRRVQVTLGTTVVDRGWRLPISSAPNQWIVMHARAQVVDLAGAAALGPAVPMPRPRAEAPSASLPIPAAARTGQIRLEVTAEWPASGTPRRIEHARAVWDWAFEQTGGLPGHPSSVLGILVTPSRESASSVGERFLLNPESTGTPAAVGGQTDASVLEGGAWARGTVALVSRDEADRWRFCFQVVTAQAGPGAAPAGAPIGGPPAQRGPRGGLLVPDAADWGSAPGRSGTSSVEFKAVATLQPVRGPEVKVEYGPANEVTLPFSQERAAVTVAVEIHWRKHDLGGIREGMCGVVWRWPQVSNHAWMLLHEVSSFSMGKGMGVDLKDTPNVLFAPNGRALLSVRVLGETGSFKQTFAVSMAREAAAVARKSR